MRDHREKAKQDIGRAFSPLADAIVERVMPTWAGLGRTDFGGPADPVGALRLPGKGPVATLRVQAQMVSARARAATAGLAMKNAPSFPAYLATLLAHFLSPDGEPGLAHRVRASGEVLDRRRTLEDHAWMLQALADSHVATGSGEILVVADLILEFIDRHLADNSTGYFEDNQGCGERRQASHARLLDAVLTLQAATGSAPYLARAASLFELFCDRLLDREGSGVGESFDRAWRVAPSGDGAIFCPASAARWVVLLRRYHSASQDSKAFELMRDLGPRLLAGRNGQGMIVSAVNAAGAVRNTTLKLGDQLRFCAALRALEHGGELQLLERRIAAHFIDPAPMGCWCETLDADGGSLGEPVSMETLATLVSYAVEAREARVHAPFLARTMYAA